MEMLPLDIFRRDFWTEEGGCDTSFSDVLPLEEGDESSLRTRSVPSPISVNNVLQACKDNCVLVRVQATPETSIQVSKRGVLMPTSASALPTHRAGCLLSSHPWRIQRNTKIRRASDGVGGRKMLLASQVLDNLL